MTIVVSGKLFSDAGQLQALGDAVTSTATVLGGWAIENTGEPFVEDLASDPVPSDAIILGGMAYSDDGILYVTTDAPSGETPIGGMAVREDGALHVDADAVTAGDIYINGWAFSQAGAGRIAITVEE